VAARSGGGDANMNPRLRTAVAATRAANMPADNIKKAIQKGTGELPGVSYEEVTYEAYGPGGVAILIEVVTDNRNRAVAELRHLLSLTQGRGLHKQKFSHYEEVPREISAKVIEEAKKQKAEAEG